MITNSLGALVLSPSQWRVACGGFTGKLSCLVMSDQSVVYVFRIGPGLGPLEARKGRVISSVLLSNSLCNSELFKSPGLD